MEEVGWKMSFDGEGMLPLEAEGWSRRQRLSVEGEGEMGSGRGK